MARALTATSAIATALIRVILYIILKGTYVESSAMADAGTR